MDPVEGQKVIRKPGLGGLTDAEIRQVIELGEAGARLSEIALAVSIPVSLVNTILSGAGVKPMLVRRALREQRVKDVAATPRKGKRGVSDRDVSILELASAGVTYQEIANRFAISRERVRQIIAKHGVDAPKLIRGHRRDLELELKNQLIERVAEWLREHPGSTIGEIGLALSISEEEVDSCLTKENRHMVLVETDPRERKGNQVRWSRNEILEAMRTAARYESPLSYSRYDTIRTENAIDGPSAIRILQIFGTWSEACHEAGVQHGRRMRNSYERRWSAHEMTEHLVDFLRQGSSGSIAAYDIWSRGKNVTGSQTIRQQFGSWTEARNQALLAMRSLWTNETDPTSPGPRGVPPCGEPTSRVPGA